ncbi:heavy metal translocating P-type ATPase [Bacillus solimangrovi]|uniref:ATPase n=1 Tax=Bacillus solimangrovi TaxID=1305675 RepID=A0A1E5LBG8_9BACI|nr:heavy metal translocating P-type ATPase [Bacillus solimangrovi]OEH91329.1 ATPase [Bacillus solimangrovi]
MNTDSQVMANHSQLESNQSSHLFVKKLKEHGELIAAMLSGLLILFGWLLDKANLSTPSIIIFLLAFVIGGFAKAKEGIEDTLANRELNVEMLMIFAAIGSAIIGHWQEGAILIFIFSLSGALETYTMNKSQREISALMEMQPEEAVRISNGEKEIVHVSKLIVGDHILVKPGELIPSDGKIINGTTTINESAITGESLPVSKSLQDDVFAGTVNLNGAVTVEVTKPNNETLFQKIITLVQSAQDEKSPSQQFIERFEGRYVKVVLIVVLFMMFLPHFIFGWSWTDTFYRAMILLVVASPCALVASIMPATLSAISNGAKSGILFKGGVHLEKLAHLQAIAFDKTGTLTRGKPEVTDVYVREGISEKEFLQAVASIESYSNHPLAQAIVQHVKSLDLLTTTPENVEDVSGWGIKGTINNTDWQIGKRDFVGAKQAEKFHNGISWSLAEEGKTLVYAKDSKGIAGVIALRDTIRSETREALKKLQAFGIHTIMLTGDNEKTAHVIAEEVGLDQYVAECLPEEKVNHLKQIQSHYENVGMVGDGINDAPALATASVGIAMGEGTDVALETADIILMKNDLSRIADTIELSKKMNRIVKQNIIFSITVILILIASNFLQLIDLPYGVIGHEGSTILVILNGLRLLRS